MKVFFSNYHISVNPTLVNDLLTAGLEVVMPDREFAREHIRFYAPNDEHRERCQIVSYRQFMAMEPMALLIPCAQMQADFLQLRGERGGVDEIVWLPAQSNAVDHYPLDATFVISHDLYFHRKTTAPYKVWYFNQPHVTVDSKTPEQFRQSFADRKISLFINHFYEAGYEPELAAAEAFREQWQAATGVRVSFFGKNNPDGWPQPPQTHREMRDSMFTLTFKRRETWGQMVNESMQLGTPAIFLREFLWSTFTEYLITPDTAIVGDTVPELIDRILGLDYPHYETLALEAQWQSRMFCNDAIRVEKIKWLFGKVEAALTAQQPAVRAL